MRSKIGTYPDNNDMLLTIHVLHYQLHFIILTCSWLCFILELIFDEALSLLGDRHPMTQEDKPRVTSRSTESCPMRAFMLCWHMDPGGGIVSKREESQLPLIDVETCHRRRPNVRRVGWTRVEDAMPSFGNFNDIVRHTHSWRSRTQRSRFWSVGLWLWSWYSQRVLREAMNIRTFNHITWRRHIYSNSFQLHVICITF
jgi:hypothetical protein